MRANANRHRRDVEFNVGDKVLLKLQQYRQHSVAKPQSAKLARRYYGPFEILERIGPVAYRLKLPEGSRIHNVFHVGLLRRYVESDHSTVFTQLPDDFCQGKPLVRPIKLLDQRILVRGTGTVEHGLVSWPDASTTWEPLPVLQRRFPELFLEGKEVVKPGGVDTSIGDHASVEVPNEVQEEREHQREGEEDEEQSENEPENHIVVNSSARPKRKTRPPNRLIDCVAK